MPGRIIAISDIHGCLAALLRSGPRPITMEI